jgi:N-methylhydantoinase A
MQHPHCRIGIDVGGTFTDFVLADRITGRLVRYKEPSVPADPSQSVERGLPPLIERAGVAPSEIELVVHGTTLALNAIIQRRGAKLGLVVSRGNRGVLEIGRAQLPNAFSFLLQKEPPLVPRSLVLEVSARLDRYGAIVADATDAELDAIAGTFAARRSMQSQSCCCTPMRDRSSRPISPPRCVAGCRAWRLRHRPRSGLSGANTSAAWSR